MNKDEIDKILYDRPDLKSEKLKIKNLEFVKEILAMSEWKEGKFKHLLTSNIWSSNPKEIKIILSMPEWNNPDYIHLLSPSIFNVSLKNIKASIELLESYGIGRYITNRFIRRNASLQIKLIEYLIENNIELIVEKSSGNYVLNPILNASNIDLKKRYGIDIYDIKKQGDVKHA